MKILVMNGPNLNLLGEREPSVYGDNSLAAINERLKDCAEKNGAEIDFFQSNHEGALIDALHGARAKYNCIIFNAGAYTHYSYAIYDAIRAVNKPFIEVHLSNIHARVQTSFCNLARMQGYSCGVWRKELYDGTVLCTEYGLMRIWLSKLIDFRLIFKS